MGQNLGKSNNQEQGTRLENTAEDSPKSKNIYLVGYTELEAWVEKS